MLCGTGFRDHFGGSERQARERKNGEIHSISETGQTLEGLKTQKSNGNPVGVTSGQICTDSLKDNTLNVILSSQTTLNRMVPAG